METTARWFGPRGRPLLGWLTAGEAARASGVVIAPPVGYAQLTTHRALRRLAELLAAEGHVVLRFDPDGTGDAAGEPRDPGRVAAWRASLAAAAAEVRSLGCERLTLVGLRLGATLALLDGHALGADAVVAWLPLESGRRYARELRLISTPVPGDDAVAVAGEVFTEATLAGLAALETAPAERPAARVLVVGRPDPALGEVDVLPPDGSEGILETSTEHAVVPVALLEAIRDWVGPAAGAPAAVTPGTQTAELDWQGARLREHVLRLGPDGLAAVETEPLAAPPSGATLLLLNSGSEPHFGPGRAWVELARGLAARGHRAVRADFRGWGESPGGELEPVPYSDHCRADVVELVRALEERGHSCVVPFGLCSAAYVALQVAAEEPLAGVIALNPQLYWRPGYTLDIEDAYLEDERRRDERLGRAGVWSLLDAAGARSRVGRWLDALHRAGAPITLLYAEGDKGITHLRLRHARRLAETVRGGRIRVVELAGVDHPLHRAWLRGRVLEALDDALRAVAAGRAAA